MKQPRGAYRTRGPRRDEQAMQLLEAGKTLDEIAATMGITRKSANNYCVRMGASGLDEGKGVPRCPRCHLALPHDVCLPESAVEYLGRRGEQNCHSGWCIR